jgi:hypothetical protein
LVLSPVALSRKVTTPDSGRVDPPAVSKTPSTTHRAGPAEPPLVRPPSPAPPVAVPLPPAAGVELGLVAAGESPPLALDVAAHPVTASAMIASPAVSWRISPPVCDCVPLRD